MAGHQWRQPQNRKRMITGCNLVDLSSSKKRNQEPLCVSFIFSIICCTVARCCKFHKCLASVEPHGMSKNSIADWKKATSEGHVARDAFFVIFCEHIVNKIARPCAHCSVAKHICFTCNLRKDRASATLFRVSRCLLKLCTACRHARLWLSLLSRSAATSSNVAPPGSLQGLNMLHADREKRYGWTMDGGCSGASKDPCRLPGPSDALQQLSVQDQECK